MTMSLNGNQCWRTPDDFWQKILEDFTPTFDAACTREDARCQAGFYYPEIDALKEDWRATGHKTIWCNPPFRDMTPWVQKCIEFTADKDEPIQRTALLLAPLSAASWVGECAREASVIRDIYPRIQFDAPCGVKRSSNARDNMLVIFSNARCTAQAFRWFWRWK